MRLILHLYKQGNQAGEAPITFETKIPITTPPVFHNQQSFMPLYKTAVKLMHQRPPAIFRNRPVALRPFSVRYSAYVEGRVLLKRISLENLSPFNTYPAPRMLSGDFQVIFDVNYRF